MNKRMYSLELKQQDGFVLAIDFQVGEDDPDYFIKYDRNGLQEQFNKLLDNLEQFKLLPLTA